jgi:hypothetical protein
VRKIVDARSYADHVAAYAERELRRAKREEEFFLKFYGPQLEAWARAQIEKHGGKMKRVRLPAGAVGFRQAQGKVSVVDARALLAWCKKNLPSAVASIERVVALTVRDHVTQTGEYPDGVEIIPPGERFFVK